jgi:hypothetical protein
MTALIPFLSRVETSSIAVLIGQSTLVTGLLSGVHLIGLTLVVGGAVVSSLRLLGLVFPEEAVAYVTAAARRGIQVGLAISVITGLLLLSPRVSTSITNVIFQVKMLLLLTAAVFHATFFRAVASGTRGVFQLRLAGALQLALWCGVALAGCAFILIE